MSDYNDRNLYFVVIPVSGLSQDLQQYLTQINPDYTAGNNTSSNRVQPPTTIRWNFSSQRFSRRLTSEEEWRSQPLISSCPREPNGTLLDPITTEVIPPERLIIDSQGSTSYCFDLRSVARLLNSGRSNANQNPFTRTNFGQQVINAVNQYIKDSLISVRIIGHDQFITEVIVPNYFTVEEFREFLEDHNLNPDLGFNGQPISDLDSQATIGELGFDGASLTSDERIVPNI